jgi:hypothetical protein
MKTVGVILASVVGFFVFVFALNYAGYLGTSFFAPRYEAVRRDTMIQSRAYSEGMQREFYRLKLQYDQAQSDAERATIRAMVIHEAEAVDRSRLPEDLRSFIERIGG